MANEYELPFSGAEIEERLGKVSNTVLFTEQELTEEQKAQVRMNIGAQAREENENYVTKEIEFFYDGDNENEDYIWVNTNNGKKAFVKVGDLPEGEINLAGGVVNSITPTNTWLNYSFDITTEILDTTVTKNSINIPAKRSGLIQIFHQGTTDSELNAVVIICSRVGYYEIAFNGWMEMLYFPEKGVYFLDARKFGGSHYIESLTCSTIISEDKEESPITYQGNEIQVFSKGICIGDSITQGVFNHSDGEITISKYSYPNILKRLTGVEIVNAGVAGLTSKTWYEASLNSDTQYGRWVNNEWVWNVAPEVTENDIVSTSLDYSGFDFAVIHLGINDVGMMGEATVEEALVTFETNINNIITKLKTANNGIKIFLATIIPCYAVTGNTVYETFNEKIREMANASENVYLIDLNTYSELFDGTVYENSHLTAIGYHKMATELAAYISYIIKTNIEEFKEIQFIGTDKHI